MIIFSLSPNFETIQIRSVIHYPNKCQHWLWWVSELALLIVVQINRQEWTRIPCSGPEINDEEGTISTIHHTLLQILQAIYWSVETVKKIPFKLSYLISWGDQAVILLKTLIKSLQYHFACMMNYCHHMTVISTIDVNFYAIFNQFL